jgi:hypothetical protein
MSVFCDFLGWWGRHLLELLPGRMTQRQPHLQNALVAQLCQDAASSGLEVTVRRRGREEPLGRFTRRWCT